MNELLTIFLVVIGFLNLVLGITVLFGSKRTPRSRLFFLFTLSVLAWCMGIALFYSTSNPADAIQYVRLYYLAATFIGFFIINFAIAFVKNSVPWLWLIIFFVPTAIISTVVLHEQGLISGVYAGGPLKVVLNEGAYSFYVAYFLTYLYAAISLIMYHYVRRTSIYSRDITALRYIFFAFIFAGTFGVYFNLVLPLFGDYSLIWAGPVGSIVMVSLIFAAIIRHGLFDVRVALARTVGYILSFTFLAIIYGIVIVLMPYVFSGSGTGGRQDPLSVISLFLLAITFQPLKRMFDTLTDKVFLKKRYDSKEMLETVGRIVTQASDRSTLLSSTIRSINKAFRLDHIEAVLLQDQKIIQRSSTGRAVHNIEQIMSVVSTFKEKIVHVNELNNHDLRQMLESAGIGLCARLETSGGRVGYLLLGNKQNGTKYNMQDVEVLNVIVYELAVAVENSNRFKEIQDFNSTLQQKVDVATAELKATNNKLHELDESKDEFISMASHQLRTPLTTVKGYISMLLDGDVGKITPQQRKVLEEAFNSSQRMVYLIGDFLNVSRLQTGKFELELHKVDFSEVVEQEVSQMQDSALSRNIRILYQRPQNIPAMSIDENKIRQVIMNFLDNALYYSRPGSEIEVSLAKHSDRVSLRVKDHGIGVPHAERHHLFTKFFRASNAKKQRPDGTGIGLFMARKVVVAHGGTIIFETQEGKGSTFGFRLPVEHLED